MFSIAVYLPHGEVSSSSLFVSNCCTLSAAMEIMVYIPQASVAKIFINLYQFASSSKQQRPTLYLEFYLYLTPTLLATSYQAFTSSRAGVHRALRGIS